MNKLKANLSDIRQFDELSAGNSMIHRLDPCIKLVVTLAFIITVTSFSKYDVSGLFPFFLYPAVLISTSNLPLLPLLKRLLLALPFVVFISIFNPIFDRAPAMLLGNLSISYGWISFFSILTRSVLAIIAALILIATTGIDAICSALQRLKVPQALTIQILFMYRYLYILFDEVQRTLQAHSLRKFQSHGIESKVWGSLIGHLLIRTLDRAQRVYQAMLSRGFDGNVRMTRVTAVKRQDLLFAAIWLIFFLFARLINVSQWLGTLLTGGC